MERQGDLGGEEIAMEIDANATAHIMSVLTDLYSDTILAVIREYSTNALDAHVAVGCTKPIEVSTPTALNPFFKVRDFGVGLDVEDIRNIYSKYGASTKRASDDFNGVLGLGCKSALTYTNQFSVVSVKNGVKTAVSVSRSENGGGGMNVVSITESDEPNSTEVSVPTRDAQFELKARQFFRFWKSGTVILNGSDPTGIKSETREISPGLFMVMGEDTDYIVMGNVAYPVEQSLSGNSRYGWNNRYAVVAYVGMGEVAFTPSREKLMMTPATKAKIAEVRKKFDADCIAMMNKDISAAATHAEAFDKFLFWKNIFRNSVPTTYRGEKIPEHFVAAASEKTADNPYGYISTYVPYGGKYALKNRASDISYQEIRKSIVVTGWDGEKVFPAIRSKMNHWAEQSGHTVSMFFILRGDSIGEPWVKPLAKVSWEEIKAIKIPRAPRAKTKPKYDIVNDKGLLEECDNITSSVILYFSPTETIAQDRNYGRAKGRPSASSRLRLKKIFPNATLVSLGLNRWDKFVKDYPGATHIKSYAQAHLNDGFKLLTEDDKTWLGMESYERESVKTLDPAKIDDPELRKFVEIAKQPRSKNVEAYLASKDACALFGTTVQPVNPTESPFTKYPLVDRSALLYHKDHLYIYLNAVYATR